MPTEDRNITFTSHELYHALYAHCVRTERKKIPAAEITNINFTGEHDDMIIVEFSNPSEGLKTTTEFSRTFIAAALIMFCRGISIPVPRAAKKSIEIADNHIRLRAVL